MTDHPIIPPSEMVNEWVRMLEFLPDKQVFSEVAQWGADQELEACIAFVRRGPWCSEKLRAARRPKPPSLKEQALTALTRYTTGETILTNDSVDIIRRALEALPE